MPKADAIHYALLAATMDRYVAAAKALPEIREEFRQTARGGIEAVRRCPMQVDDAELLGLCDSAEETVAED